MRDLEVLRVESDGQYVICIDRETDEHFRLRADDALRAAARGDTTELGQMPVSGDAALRPREIQARIRAGASVDELAEIAGVSAAKINRYAHPVLLERARAAELARASHPMGMDGPVLATLGELVAECLVLRGDVPADARWDAWKAPDGQWVVQVSLHEGSTEHFAHWRFHPGSHGGTADPIDELAVELTDPELARTARRNRLATVPREPAQAPRRESRPDGHAEVTVDADVLMARQTQPRRPQPPLADVLDLQYSTPPAGSAPAEAPPAEAPPAPAATESAPAEPVSDSGPAPDAEAGPEGSGQTAVPTPGDLAKRGRPATPPPAEKDSARSGSRHRAKRGKPAVPAWEDVLLGVRSHED